MATLEQVEKLREKANVSYEEARAALEACNDDLLDALIYLEKQGRVSSPAGGGYYSSQNAPEQTPVPVEYRQSGQNCGGGFGDAMRKLGHFLAKIFRIGNTNALVGVKNGTEVFACPITAVILLLVFFFWVVVPLFILSLFFNFRYHFRGNEFGKDSINKAMDGATDAAEDIKKNFGGEKQN